MKGLRIISGKYLQARVSHDGVTKTKNFPEDSPLCRHLAEKWLIEQKDAILMGKFGIEKELPSKLFPEAAEIWLKIWSEEENPDGTKKHNESAIKEATRVISKSFSPLLRQVIHEIRPLDIEGWRKHLLSTGISGTGVNRYQATLSSIFNGLDRWIKTEKIKAFKLPVNREGHFENPCDAVEKAPNVKRKRIWSIQELKVFKQVCISRNDADLWEICEMALRSLLRKKDLFALETGIDIDTTQFKTQRPIHLPITVLRLLNYKNFRKRFEGARKDAGLEFRLPNGKIDKEKTPRLMDLRKTGNNLLKMQGVSSKVRQEILGHASLRTTEIYDIPDQEHLKKPLEDLNQLIKGL